MADIPPSPPDAVASGRGASAPRASTLVQAGIVLSRLSGLVRQRAVGHFLGLSGASEAFAAAVRIPNLLQNLLGEGVLSASFIPVQVELLDAGRRDEARQLAGTVLGLLSATAGAVALLFVLGADLIVALLLPAKGADVQALAADLLRIIAPGTALLVVSAWCLGVLNSERRFFLSYVAPVLWNLAQVIAIVVAGVLLLDDPLTPPEDGAVLGSIARGLALGTALGGLLQLLVQVPAVRGLLPGVRPRLGPFTPEVRRVVRSFVPVVGGRGVVQVLGFVELLLASLLAGTAIAVLHNVHVLSVLPVSLFGMSVAAAELPELAGARRGDRVALGTRLDEGLARIAFYVLPTTVGFVVLGDVLVGALLQTGAFDADDTLLVWVVLIGASVGLVATTSSRLLQSLLYGVGDTRTPAVLAAGRVIAAAALGAVLMLQFDRVLVSPEGFRLLEGATLPAFGPLPAAVRLEPDVLHLGAAGITLATGLTAIVEFRLLRQAVALRLGRDVRAGGDERRQLVLASAASLLAALVLRRVVADQPILLAAPVAVLGVAVVHIGVARALGVREATHLVAAGRRLVGRVLS